MSRALENDIAQSLKDGDHLKVFQDISSVLTEGRDEGLLEIELLGRSHPLEPGINFLEDGAAIAIPKLRLVQAFLVAREILQNHLRGGSVRDEELQAAAAVLLLMDPEHLTAANVRKRIIKQSLSAGVYAGETLAAEKYFVDSLLTSRLHRHTKSPTLWNHRRWLMQQFAVANLPMNPLEDLRNVIMVAGERHPRNYYAWFHARWLMRSIIREDGASDLGTEDELVVTVKDWCYKHHTDISGWSFLAYLLGLYNQMRIVSRTNVFTETLELACSFQWKNESVWWFLRTLAASGIIQDSDLAKFKEIVADIPVSNAKDTSEAKVLRMARDWYNDYRQEGSDQAKPVS